MPSSNRHTQLLNTVQAAATAVYMYNQGVYTPWYNIRSLSREGSELMQYEFYT